ncbi:methylmalonyl-CoA epimerase [Sphaerisporangium melleum]|uniref:Methylmalonyl-CoA epimerase n=1 Tax=Sphaerisporangium melleum TaxID=321316 RepID=A0A917R2I2_9ACTN|nr:methylmalonyl-CoA epimerase [Sphaerisporangium melleum]GGK86039.1 methylmalonyl-CoA epimerase [Sphaerisporangium melleum]GII71458.1 methylmalonyl-CoA epimerase [Sphaerisporangium melleum]
MLLRIDHVGIACENLDEKIAFYESTFGVTVVSREVNEEQGVKEAMLHVADGEGGGSYIQLLEPLSAGSPVGKFLAKRGEGIHHVAYGVSDVTKAMEAIGAKGVRLVDLHPRHGAMGTSIAFLHPKDVGGVLTELVESPPRPS